MLIRINYKKLWCKLKPILLVQAIGILFSSFCLVSSGCSTGYWADRLHDGGDIFTAGVGVGAGVQARIGLLSTGLGLHGSFVGLESGQVFAEVDDMEGGDFSILLYSLHESRHDQYVIDRHKDYKQQHVFGLATLSGNHGSAQVLFRKSARRNPSYYSQIEISVGLMGSLKVGFNPGELLDFLLGFMGIDIYSDDLEGRKKQKIEQENSG